VFTQRPAEVALENGQAPIAAGRLAALVPGYSITLNVGFAARVERAIFGLREPIGVERQVAPVGRERIRRQAVLDPQRIDEAVYRLLTRFPCAAFQNVTPA
jgi:hypothetical protein